MSKTIAWGEPDTTRAILIVWNGAEPFEPGLLILEDAEGTPYYLWASTAGVLRIHTAPPESDTDGEAVGSQY